MRENLLLVLKELEGNLYWDTSMILELICESMAYNYGYSECYFCGRSVYVDGVRVLSIRTGKEGKNLVYLDTYKLFL